jgi:hypothetical protein
MYLTTQSEYNCAVHVAGYYVYAKHKLKKIAVLTGKAVNSIWSLLGTYKQTRFH